MAKLVVHVTGDVCLDVVAVPTPPGDRTKDNWRQTGETRTHLLPGGAMLLANFIRAALPKAEVHEPAAVLPEKLAEGKGGNTRLSQKEFLATAERLTREEVVHSLLGASYVRESPGDKEANTLRVDATYGYAGPQVGDPTLTLVPPDSADAPHILVLDDTGNRFRRSRAHWPRAIGSGIENPIVVYKLHRPLPGPNDSASTKPSPLWNAVKTRFPQRRVVLVSIDDLRDHDVLISRGLSWERTALDLVWQLLNVGEFALLRDCPHLIVRMGLNGAMYWRRLAAEKKGDPDRYEAWLIYDPTGIEDAAERGREGRMVGYGSLFAASIVRSLGKVAQKASVPDDVMQKALMEGIKIGLEAGRRLLKQGFGKRSGDQSITPQYPGAKIFAQISGNDFACRKIPAIPQATVADRGFWRLIDDIFLGKADLLHRAVSLKATQQKPVDPKDKDAAELLKQVPTAGFGKGFQAYDRLEIENYRALYALMLDYVQLAAPPRPLSVAVFGPPGAGKSFGIKKVAESFEHLRLARAMHSLTFNLSQYQSPDQLADAFHQVRDLALKGKIPLVFFDEFDTTLAGKQLGWLQYFLAPMQDGEFLDRGVPHPVGQAIFVFAGGTCGSYSEFAKPFCKPEADDSVSERDFRNAKGPDFLSRLRGTLDVPGLDLHSTFDAYGPPEMLPCESAILLRRAGILAFQLKEKGPQLRDANDSFQVSNAVLRALLHLPHFEHGNRSFEALLDMSRLPGATKFTPSLLPASRHANLHANAQQLGQLLLADYPFPEAARELIAQSIHELYLDQNAAKVREKPDDKRFQPWKTLSTDDRESNYQQADNIAVKLRSVGLWFRATKSEKTAAIDAGRQMLEPFVEQLARAEHDRWVAEKRRQGWIAAANTEASSRRDHLKWHNCLFRWEELSNDVQDLDREPVRNIPRHLAAGGYEVFRP